MKKLLSLTAVIALLFTTNAHSACQLEGKIKHKEGFKVFVEFTNITQNCSIRKLKNGVKIDAPSNELLISAPTGSEVVYNYHPVKNKWHLEQVTMR